MQVKDSVRKSTAVQIILLFNKLAANVKALSGPSYVMLVTACLLVIPVITKYRKTKMS